MTSRRLIVGSQALRDIDDLSDFIALNSPAAAARLRGAIEQLAEDLLAWPESYPRFFPGHPRVGHLRKAYPRGFPNHIVLFLLNQEAVKIVRVIHAARDVVAVLDGAESYSQEQ